MAASGNPRHRGRVAFTYPSYRLYPDRAIFHRARHGDAVRRHRLAGVRNHPASARSRPRGPLRNFFPASCCFWFPATPPIATTAAKFSPWATRDSRFARRCCWRSRFAAQHIRLPDLRAWSCWSASCAAFNAPASRAILPLLVPEEHFQSAFAWGATIFEAATILGPAVGGLIYATLPQDRPRCTPRRRLPPRPPRFRCSA